MCGYAAKGLYCGSPPSSLETRRPPARSGSKAAVAVLGVLGEAGPAVKAPWNKKHGLFLPSKRKPKRPNRQPLNPFPRLRAPCVAFQGKRSGSDKRQRSDQRSAALVSIKHYGAPMRKRKALIRKNKKRAFFAETLFSCVSFSVVGEHCTFLPEGLERRCGIR